MGEMKAIVNVNYCGVDKKFQPDNKNLSPFLVKWILYCFEEARKKK